MTDKIQELLAVLDMPEKEQWSWALVNKHRNTYRESLADLAFRLRDEAVDKKLKCFMSDCWYMALQDVYEYEFERGRTEPKIHEADWLVAVGQPIHWIIAALIAKELNKEN